VTGEIRQGQFRVRLCRTVYGFPLPASELPPVGAPGEHVATMNRNGAVSILLADGSQLGVKAGEFEFVDYPDLSADWLNVPKVFATMERLRGEAAELTRLFDLQHTRTKEADEVWRRANPDRGDVQPDLGELVDWLLRQRSGVTSERLRAAPDQLEKVTAVAAERERLRAVVAETAENVDSLACVAFGRELAQLDDTVRSPILKVIQAQRARAAVDWRDPTEAERKASAFDEVRGLWWEFCDEDEGEAALRCIGEFIGQWEHAHDRARGNNLDSPPPPPPVREQLASALREVDGLCGVIASSAEKAHRRGLEILERHLGPALKADFERHVQGCEVCRASAGPEGVCPEARYWVDALGLAKGSGKEAPAAPAGGPAVGAAGPDDPGPMIMISKLKSNCALRVVSGSPPAELLRVPMGANPADLRALGFPDVATAMERGGEGNTHRFAVANDIGAPSELLVMGSPNKELLDSGAEDVSAHKGPWRTGRQVGRTVYDADDRLIGVMDTPALATLAAAAPELLDRYRVAVAIIGAECDPDEEEQREAEDFIRRVEESP
jgi:hypothetical protein